jgi:long-subunit acyl-CoA synthetase (AMP-forming)
VVALMMPNRSEHVLADLGAVHAGGVPTTVYATLAGEQIAFVAGDCSARFAVLDGRDQLDRWLPVLDRLPALRTVIVLDAATCPPRNAPRFDSPNRVMYFLLPLVVRTKPPETSPPDDKPPLRWGGGRRRKTPVETT